MTSFNSSSFPDSLAIAKEGSMTIGAHSIAIGIVLLGLPTSQPLHT